LNHAVIVPGVADVEVQDGSPPFLSS
jgi:hypothetical protein